MFPEKIYKTSKRKSMNKMNNKFVLESFQSYLEFAESKINEGKGEFTLDLDFVKSYVEKIIEKQKEMVSTSTIFSKFEKDKNPYESWLANWKKMHEGRDWPDKKSPIALHVYGSFAAPYLWDKLVPEQKDAIYKDMLSLMKGSGYKTEKEFNKLLKDKSTIGAKPYVAVIPSFVEIPPTETPVPGKITIDGIDADIQNKVFKDNRWGSGEDSAGEKVNPEAFQDPAVLADIKKEIDSFMQKFASGEIVKINSFKVESSASRYKNTNDSKGGRAEKLSWGELSYNRAITILNLFSEAADTYNLSDEKREELKSKIEIDSKGANGDGTSGPNPPLPGGANPNIGFGYYDQNSKWVPDNGTFGKGKTPEENRKLLVIAELGEGGKPTGKYTTATLDPEETSANYGKFRYVNFIIDADIVSKEPDMIVKLPGKKETKYTPKVGFPKTTSDSGPPVKRKKKRRGIIGIPGKGTSPYFCPGDQF